MSKEGLTTLAGKRRRTNGYRSGYRRRYGSKGRRRMPSGAATAALRIARTLRAQREVKIYDYTFHATASSRANDVPVTFNIFESMAVGSGQRFREGNRITVQKLEFCVAAKQALDLNIESHEPVCKVLIWQESKIIFNDPSSTNTAGHYFEVGTGGVAETGITGQGAGILHLGGCTPKGPEQFYNSKTLFSKAFVLKNSAGVFTAGGGVTDLDQIQGPTKLIDGKINKGFVRSIQFQGSNATSNVTNRIMVTFIDDSRTGANNNAVSYEGYVRVFFTDS